MRKIVVLGSANVDISARTARFPANGETVSGESVHMGMGGKGANQATAAARCGADVTMIAKVGEDSFAEIPLSHFERETIGARYVYRTSAAGTGCALIEVCTVSGENRITVVSGANQAISEAEVLAAEADIAAADVLLTQMETNPEAIEVFLTLGKKHGKPVVLNPAPALPIPAHWYPMIDTITPNETEACAYTGVEPKNDDSAAKAAAVFHERGVSHVVITCGSRGVFVSSHDRDSEKTVSYTVPTNRVEAVDTTGAGDAFNGAFCAALSEGMERRDACRFACCAATLSVTRAGAAEAMPMRDEVDEVYHRYYQSGRSIEVRARMLAAEHRLFWRAIEGSGDNGMVTVEDVRRVLREKEKK